MRLSRPVLALLAALVLVVLVPTQARSWPHGPTNSVSVNPGPYTPYNPLVCADASGGFFVAFLDYRTGYAQIMVQHFDGAGTALWTAGALSAGTTPQDALGIVADKAGGAIVLWERWDTGYTHNDYYMQRVNSSGAAMWAAGGIALCTTAGGKQSATLLPDGANGAYVIWQDFRNSGTTGSDIYAQHVGAFASLFYPVDGIALCSASGDQVTPSANLNEYGYCGVAWVDGRAGGFDIYAQSLQWSGGAYWAANGVLVCNAPGAKYTPFISGASSGQFVVAWTDSRSSNYDVYGQMLQEWNGSGEWAVNGLPVVSGTGYQSLSTMRADKFGGFVCYYQEYGTGPNWKLMAQKVDGNGTAQWYYPVTVRDAPNGIYYIQATADGLGGTMVTWMDQRVDYGDIYAQRLDSYGNPRWQSGGLPVATSANGQEYPSICAGLTGGAFVAWQDNGPNYGARMNAVDEWGYLGADPIMSSVRDVPNDQGGQVKVSWYASPLDTDPLFRNITQYYVFRSVPTHVAAMLAKLAESGKFSAQGALSMDGGRTYRRTRFAAQDYFWEQVATVTPHHLPGYSAVVATEGDSVAGSNPRTAFMVMAESYYGGAFWFSKADSGYSVDNLAPVAPAPFTGQQSTGEVHLHWNPNTEPDLAGYRLYRGHEPSFTPGPGTFVTALPETGYSATEELPWYYKLTAIDSHGNESPAAFLLPYGTLDAPDVAAGVFFLASPAPNPVTRGRDASLRFGLSRAGRAELVVMDAAGRRVRTLVRGDLAAGEHRATWDGRDEHGNGVAAGIYFVRYSAEGQSASKRIVRID
jgi:hypothetical protein